MNEKTGRPDAGTNRHAWLTLVAMTGSLSMTLLDQTVVTVALPTMARQLSLSGNQQQWVVNAYVLVMAATVALGGKLGSKLGPVTTFVAGVITFFVASALCGLTPAGHLGAGWMITARVLQGLGAALMLTVSATIVMAAFPASVRGRAMGAYVGISQIFLALGPLIGGVLTEHATWRLVFWVNLPVGLVALALVTLARPANPKQPELAIRPAAVALLVTAVGLTVFTLQQSSSWGWSSLRTPGLLVVGLVLGGVFIRAELGASDPLVQVRLLARRVFAGNLLVLFGVQFGLLAIVLYSTLYSQNLLGFSPVTAGLASMPMILPLMVGAQLAGRWYDRSGVRGPVLTGLLLCMLGSAVWTYTLTDITYPSKIPGMVLVGLGLGLVFSPVNTDALSRVIPGERPQASGIIQTVRQLGGTLGVAVIGSVILSHEHPTVPLAGRAADVASAMQVGYVVAVVVFALALLAARVLLPRRRTGESPEGTDVDVAEVRS